MKALITLTSSESKRLIAKGISSLPEVEKAKRNGRIIVGGGTTNGYVVEELTGTEVDKANYTFGIVNEGLHCSTSKESREKNIPLRLIDGKVSKRPAPEILKEFTNKDVFIKGANAVDPYGNAGILIASPVGGTIGGAYSILVSRKANLIVPVGLEKLIPSVVEAAEVGGMYDFDLTMGMRCSLWTLTDAIVITEIAALQILFDVTAVHFSSGGSGDSSGAVTLAITGEEEKVKKAFSYLRSIKGEPALSNSRRSCLECEDPCDFV